MLGDRGLVPAGNLLIEGQLRLLLLQKVRNLQHYRFGLNLLLRVVGNKSALYSDKLRVLRRRESVHVCLLWVGAHLTVGKHRLNDVVSV